MNYRSRRGEIDIVALDGPAVVFVEVKRRVRMGDALEAVGRAKRESLMRTALDFLLRSAMLERPVRFDVVSVDGNGRVCGHLRDAFDMTL